MYIDRRVPPKNGAFKLDGKTGFTLVEMLAVLTLMAIVVTPLLVASLGVVDMTRGVDQVAGVLERAASYARSDNTYVWVGFFEENVGAPSVNPAKAGVGRVVISTVASKDSTPIVDPFGHGTQIDPARLVQVGKLLKLENFHFADVSPPLNPDQGGGGDCWDTRPEVRTAQKTSRIGGSSPSSTIFPFTYPVGSGVAAAQYNFVKTIEFSPDGEAVLNTSYSLVPWIEVGLQMVHGVSGRLDGSNLAAIQVSGVTGEVKIYRR